MSEVIRFTCKDRKDQPHDYVVTPFGFDEGFDLLNEIIEIIGEPIGDLVGGLTGGSISEDTDPEKVEFDLTKLGPALVTFARKLQMRGGSKVVARILAKAKRKDDNGQLMALKTASARTMAYTQNTGEVFEAVGRIIWENFSPFSPDSMTGSNGFLSMLQNFTQSGTTPTEPLKCGNTTDGGKPKQNS